MHTVFYCIYIKCIRSSVFHEPTVQLHPATPQSEKATQMESSYFTLYRNIYIFSMNRYLCISGFSSKAATARRMMSRTGVVKGRNESVGKLERSFSFCPSSFSLATSFFISKSSPLFLLLGLLHLRVGLPTGTITVKSANHPLGSAHSRSRQIQHSFSIFNTFQNIFASSILLTKLPPSLAAEQ